MKLYVFYQTSYGDFQPEWLTDKARFWFDSVKRQRCTAVMYKVNEEKYTSLSLKNAFKVILYQSGLVKSIKMTIGKLSDCRKFIRSENSGQKHGFRGFH